MFDLFIYLIDRKKDICVFYKFLVISHYGANESDLIRTKMLHLFCFQPERLRFIRDQLRVSGFVSEFQAVSPERAGSEYERPAELSGEAALSGTGESQL